MRWEKRERRLRAAMDSKGMRAVECRIVYSFSHGNQAAVPIAVGIIYYSWPRSKETFIRSELRHQLGSNGVACSLPKSIAVLSHRVTPWTRFLARTRRTRSTEGHSSCFGDRIGVGLPRPCWLTGRRLRRRCPCPSPLPICHLTAVLQ